MSMSKIEKSALDLQELLYPFSTVKLVLEDRILDYIKQNPGCEKEYLSREYCNGRFYCGNVSQIKLEDIIFSLLENKKIYLKNNYIYAKGFTDHKKFNDAIYFADESQLEQERKFFTDDENSKEMLRTMRQF